MSKNERAPATADAGVSVVRVGLLALLLWLPTAGVGLAAGPGILRRSVANLASVALFSLFAWGALRRRRGGGAPSTLHARSWRLAVWAGLLGGVSSLSFAVIPAVPLTWAGTLGLVARVTSIAPPLLVAGALMIVRRPATGVSRPLVSGLDAGIFAGASFLFLWLIGFRHVSSALQPGLDAVAVLTPFVGSALVLGVVAYHWADTEIPALSPLGLVGTWATLGLLFEGAFAFTYAAGRWHPGHPIELLGLVRMIPLAMAPFAALSALERPRPRAVPGDVLIYLPTGAALVASVLHGARGTLVYDPVTVTLFLAVGFAILIRQFVALQAVRTLSRTLERRVEERTHELIEARQTIERSQRLEAVGRLAGGVAHDFNNLLAAIAGHAGLLREDLPEGADGLEDLAAIEKAAERGASLTRQLLTFARHEPGEVRPTELAPLVTETVSFLRRVAPAGVTLRLDAGTWSPLVRIDPTHVDQLVTNLVVNAQQAVGSAGHIDVALASTTVDDALAALHGVESGAYVRLTVQDDGVGIPDDVAERVFEPFYSTRGKVQGTGLGLATCYGIASGAGGFLTFDSEVGVGTAFHCWLPVFREAGAVDGTA